MCARLTPLDMCLVVPPGTTLRRTVHVHVHAQGAMEMEQWGRGNCASQSLPTH